MLRAIREGHRVLLATLGIPITPSSHKVFRWIPEFLLVAITRRKLNDAASSIKIGHAAVARDEMKAIAIELSELALESGIKTPAIDQLRACFLETERPADEKCHPHATATGRHARDFHCDSREVTLGKDEVTVSELSTTDDSTCKRNASQPREANDSDGSQS